MWQKCISFNYHNLPKWTNKLPNWAQMYCDKFQLWPIPSTVCLTISGNLLWLNMFFISYNISYYFLTIFSSFYCYMYSINFVTFFNVQKRTIALVLVNKPLNYPTCGEGWSFRPSDSDILNTSLQPLNYPTCGEGWSIRPSDINMLSHN